MVMYLACLIDVTPDRYHTLNLSSKEESFASLKCYLQFSIVQKDRAEVTRSEVR